MSAPHINIFLDDVRECPPGFLLARTGEEFMAVVCACSGKIAILSLDNDLGEGEPEGYQLLNWLEEEIYYGRLTLPEKIVIHSANPPARDYMERTIEYMYDRYQA